MDEKNIIKKRGRKPKNKTEDNEKKVVKKRGRKPTSKILSVKSTEISNLDNDEKCIIAHIPLKSEDIENISSKSLNSTSNSESLSSKVLMNNSNNDFNDKYIKYLENQINELKQKIVDIQKNNNSNNIFYKDYSIEKLKSKIIISQNNNYILTDKTNILCWWCCHSFDNVPFPLPDKIIDDKYNVFGIFCSASCAIAYNIDLNDHRQWERNSLIIKLYNELTDDNEKSIYPSLPKQFLKSFGGSLEIDEYREKSKKVCSNRFIIPPMIPLITLIEECYKDRNTYNWENKINISKYNNLKNNIKIKTKNKENSLEKMMGLKKIKISN